MLDVLVSKLPSGQDAHPVTLISIDDASVNDTLQVHSVLFDNIDAAAIRSAAVCIFGAAGPSGLDARD